MSRVAVLCGGLRRPACMPSITVMRVVPVRGYASSSPAPSDSEESTASNAKPDTRRWGKREITLNTGTQWLETAGKKYNLLTPRNWLHPERPFPKNPWFVPPVPVGDATRQEIYNRYLEDPRQWTPRKLAEEYQLSILRIEAILRLKHLEAKQVAQGYKPQRTFRKKMEAMLGVDAEERIQEPVDTLLARRPTVDDARLVSEGDEEEEAAKRFAAANLEFNRTGGIPTQKEPEPVQEKPLGTRRRLDGNYILALSGVLEENELAPTILEEKNPRETNVRWKFLIADMGKAKGEDQDTKMGERTVLVRDHDGTLRTATRAETKMHFRLYPLKDLKKLPMQATRDLWQV